MNGNCRQLIGQCHLNTTTDFMPFNRLKIWGHSKKLWNMTNFIFNSLNQHRNQKINKCLPLVKFSAPTLRFPVRILYNPISDFHLYISSKLYFERHIFSLIQRHTLLILPNGFPHISFNKYSWVSKNNFTSYYEIFGWQLRTDDMFLNFRSFFMKICQQFTWTLSCFHKKLGVPYQV
jgi:hypothetical protein